MSQPLTTHEQALYNAGQRLISTGQSLPDLPLPDLAHVLRGLWDRSGFIGRNTGGYPVVSLVAPRTLAEQIAATIEHVTGRRSPARPLPSGGYWVGVSGRVCGPWLRYLYGDAAPSPRHSQLRELLVGR